MHTVMIRRLRAEAPLRIRLLFVTGAGRAPLAKSYALKATPECRVSRASRVINVNIQGRSPLLLIYSWF